MSVSLALDVLQDPGHHRVLQHPDVCEFLGMEILEV